MERCCWHTPFSTGSSDATLKCANPFKNGTIREVTLFASYDSTQSQFLVTDPEKPMLLYVEDEVLIRVQVIEGLEDAGYSVVVAKSGAEALSSLAKHNSELRGVVTDINLGSGIDGWEVARTAREAIGGLPVVYVSAASQEEWTSRGVPGSVMIAKPFATAQVVVAISSLMTTSDAPA